MRYMQRKSRSGQTTAEYAIIVALVAVCSIAVIMIFGDQIRALIAGESTKLASDGSTPVQVDNVSGGAQQAEHGKLNQF